MSGANKILTVSYGTFSCTIEGFEEPFGTMKQIAEYFRDLAAEDRYFGAEPPVPDAEALRHLAEREAARRVEARMGANGVHLRQLDDAAAAEAATPVSQVAPRMAAAATASASADVLTPSEVIDPEPESVAARLSRIRAVVARARSTSVWPDEVVEVADAEEGADMAPEIARHSVSEFTPSETLMSGPVSFEPIQTETNSRTEDPAPQADPDAASAAMDDDIGFSASADLSLPDVLAEAEPGPVLLADASDEGSDVAGFSQASSEEIDIAEDANTVLPTGFDEPANHAEAANEGTWQQDDVVSEIDDALVAEPHYLGSESAAWHAEDEWQEEAAAQDLHAPDLGVDEETDSDGTFADPRSDIADSPAARLVALRKSDHAAAVATDRLEDVLSGRLAPQDVFAGSGDAPDDILAENADPETDTQDERAASLLAAIRAIGDAEGETSEEATDNLDEAHSEATVEIETVEAWRLDSEHDGEALDYAEMTAPPLRLDEALRVTLDNASDDAATVDETTVDLSGASMSEMPADEVDDEFDPSDDSDTTPLLLSNDPEADESDGEIADAAYEDAASHQRAGHDLAVEDLERVPEEASVDRLLAETNSQLESTEMNRRRSAIAHLKAAVAAARADKVEPEGGPRPDQAGIGSALDKFREDLARVVRPRRPVDDRQPRAVRRMPPLMLVSEQRVDGADAPARSLDAIAGTVRPRRITTREVSSDEGEEGSTGGFAGFAESMGARDLPDMLEAAAAYTAFVEGRPSFSRPQLMQMMRDAEGAEDEFSREEQLRSFGLLLRQGRIQKLKRGQFTVADDTRFRPEHRHAGE